MELENILSEFLSILKNERNIESRTELLDRNNKQQIESVTFDELLNNARLRHNMNFFPSDYPGGCYEVAMFVSLQSNNVWGLAVVLFLLLLNKFCDR